MIRLFVSDIDGTLEDPEGIFEEETIEAIKFFQEKGGTFMVATGRNSWEVDEITSRIDNVILNCANGSLLCEEDGTEILSYCLDEPTVRTFHELGTRYGLMMQFHCRDISIVANDPKTFRKQCIDALQRDDHASLQKAEAIYERIYEQPYTLIGSSLNEILKHKVLKLEYLFMEKERFEHLYPILKDAFPCCSIAEKTFLYNIEFSNRDSDKGKIIREYCRIKGIKEEETAVIGDSNNDLPMIRLFRNSYAMANGSAEVKKAASFPADDNAHLGAAKVLRQIIENNERL
ncbi:MAG: HAD family hydrolase [Erysipelotrichaceae bacterium]|nr:HAD family hydrolase [Erysipelotrichaceae bacterium]